MVEHEETTPSVPAARFSPLWALVAAWAVAVAGGVVLLGSAVAAVMDLTAHDDTFDGLLAYLALMVAMYVVVPFVAAVAYLVTRRRVVFTVLAVVCVALAAVGIFFWLTG